MANTTSSPDRAPQHLFDAWPEIARRIARADRISLFADFDGTLTAIRRRAASVRLSARVRGLLSSLVHRGHVVGIVSGRGLEDVRRRVGLPGLWYVGAHGFLIRAPDRHTVMLVSAKQQRLIARVARRLVQLMQDRPGIDVEPKIAAIAVHHRNASAASERAAHSAVRATTAAEPGLRMIAGKKVWEILPAAPVDKYRAVRFILRSERRRPGGGPGLAFYVGDDVADEAVFARLHGVTVSVGRTHDTLAKYFVRSPAEVGELLARLDRGGGRLRRRHGSA